MTQESSESRISVRVESSLAQTLQELADRKYEGRLSMVAREAFRRIVDDEAEHEDTKKQAA